MDAKQQAPTVTRAVRRHKHLQGMREPAEDIFFSLFIANELGAFQVAADVLLQGRRQVAVGHKFSHPLHLETGRSRLEHKLACKTAQTIDFCCACW